MQIRRISIPYEGREKYKSGVGQSVKTMISNYVNGMMGGGTATGGNTSGGDDNRGGNASSFFCFLSKTNGTYSALDLAESAVTEHIQVMGYKNQDQAQTFVGDISESASTNYGISGLTSGMTVSVSGNGTTVATIILTIDSTVTGNSGTLSIPIAVNINDNDLDPYQYVWHENTNKCMQMTLSFTWAINRAAAANYVLDLSNQTAGVNCDSAGTLYPNSIATLQCTAETYYNGTEATGITYSAYTESFYGATGFSIDQNSGVLTFNSGGTRFYWNTNYPALAINIVAKKEGTPIATKTMTINRNYPGTDGTPAHTRYILTDVDAIVFDPDTSGFTPTSVTGIVWLQVGDELPVQDTATTIYKWYNDLETGKTSATGSITGNTYLGLSSITFALKNASDQYYEIEEVPVLSNGKTGPSGATGASGATGPSGESAWYLTLTNDNASINCDSAGTVIGNVLAITSKAKLFYGGTLQTNAGFEVDYGTASGVTTGVSSEGVLTLSFENNFAFTGTTLSISVSGKSGNSVKDVKIMTINKSYPGTNGETPYIGSNGNWWIGNTDTGIKAEGESGETPYIGSNGNWWIGNTDTGVKAEGTDAVSYWLNISDGNIIYNPNDNTFSPSAITANGNKQVGQDAVSPALDAKITYKWQSRATKAYTSATTYTGRITITSAICETYSRLRFIMTDTDGFVQYDLEDVDILRDGLDGASGQGRTGASIRGPYDYYAVSASSRCWCAGQASGACDECEKWIDVIYKDNVYYYCNTTYSGPIDWANKSSYWTSGDSFDFIATNLLLANNASIKFLSNNELYLMDGDDITGGAAGGSGVTFWAGSDSPSDAPFQVNASGQVTATEGKIAGWDLTTSGYSYSAGSGENYLHSEINHDGIQFDATPAGNNQHFSAGLDGIHLSTEGIMSAITIGGNGETNVVFEGDGTFLCEKPIVGGIYGEPVKVNGLESSGNVTMNGGTEIAVGSIFPSNVKIAFITTASTSGTYFTKKIVNGNYYWHFNTDMNLNILAEATNGYPYMVAGTGTYAGQWVASDGTGHYKATGIYNPNFSSKKGDTLYFEI